MAAVGFQPGAVERAVLETPGAIGLVVIVTNDYSTPRPPGTAEHLSPLRGTLQDGLALRNAFSALKFAVCWEKNTTGATLRGIISEIGRLKFHQVEHYRCIMFIFAGHGCEGDCLWMQDGSKLQVCLDVVTPLLPKNAKTIGSINKAFLIDACRGEKETQTVLVPRSSSFPTGASEARGGSLMESMRVCEEGNFLLAYSTLRRHKAYEDYKTGGVWLSTLARFLNERRGLLSLESLLTDINAELVKRKGDFKWQQPDKYSTLNGHINLDPNNTGEKTRTAIAAVLQGGDANSVTDLQKPDSQYVLLLSRYARSRGLEVQYTNTPHYMEEYNSTYHISEVVVRWGKGEEANWNSTLCHYSIELANEEVAKMAYQSLTGTVESRNTVPMPTLESAPPSARQYSSGLCNQPGKPTPPNCRALLNEYCQKHAVTLKDEYIEDHSTGKPLFKCTITCLLDGNKIVRDSGQSYYPRKDDAKEAAAGGILKAIKEKEKSRSRGATAAVASPSVATNMIWKSKLKEHYDKKGMLGMDLKYKTTEVDGNFVSSIYIQELGREVKGAKARNKKEAEQNAAKEAVQGLSKKYGT